MEDKDNSDLALSSFASLNQSLSSPLNDDLAKILEKLEIKGEIKEEKHPLVLFMKEKWPKLKTSRIKYSYTNAQTKWKEFEINDKIYLFRITNKIDKKIKDLIRAEYKIHSENEELKSPEFICFFLSKSPTFSLFTIEKYYTLEEILEKKKIINFSDETTKFSMDELLQASLETIKNLMPDPDSDETDKKYYICPFFTPDNLLCTETFGKEFFLLSEIFLATNSVEEETQEIELINKNIKDWLPPEFKKNKAKLSFASNIYCLGNIFYKIAFNKNPKANIKIPENSLYKKLIENCLENTKNKRWSIEDIQKYINENEFDEEEKEE